MWRRPRLQVPSSSLVSFRIAVDYLQPEPMTQSPTHLVATAKGGVNVPAYAYAYNNPLHYTDDTGLFALNRKCTNWDEAMQGAKKRAGCGSDT
jgi:hypothetical protein